jgi:hypothetical protein
MNRIGRGITRSLILAAPMLLVVSFALAAPIHRLAADFQNSSTGANEVFTIATAPAIVTPSTAPAPVGNLVYSKSLSIPFDVVYITFSAQGDTHGDAALQMQATVTDSAGNTTICQPLAGQTGPGGGGPTLAPGWYTLVNLPDAGAATTNCNNGGGGRADCHDNAIMFSCCAQITKPDGGGTTHSVNIGLASSNGGAVFYERSTIYIDGSPNPGGQLCTGHGVP